MLTIAATDIVKYVFCGVSENFLHRYLLNVTVKKLI